MYFAFRGRDYAWHCGLGRSGIFNRIREALGAANAPSFWFGEYNLSESLLKMDITGNAEVDMLPILLTLFLMGFLDTLGTLLE